MNVSSCLSLIEAKLCLGTVEGDKTISGICTDTRKVKKDCVFICISGARFDSHDKINDIEAAGAALILTEEAFWEKPEAKDLCEHPKRVSCPVVSVKDVRLAKAVLFAAYYQNPEKELTLVGVTGSKGKTTITHMIAHILEKAGVRVGTIGTNGAIWNGHVTDLSNTTPDSDEIAEYLYKMKQDGISTVIVECSSQGLMQHRTAALPFAIGVFSNIEHGDHIGPHEHKSFEEYLESKKLLLKQSKKVVVNQDDPHIESMLSGITAECITCSRKGNGLYTTENEYESEPQKEPFVQFDAKKNGTAFGSFMVNMPGSFNIGNALLAIAVCDCLGVKPEAMKEGLSDMHISGRLEMVYRSKTLDVCVDFAHNGLSTRNLLKALRSYGPKRLICIFGADGNRAYSRRVEMGEASGSLADLSVVTSGHNRYETFEQIFVGVKEGLDKTNGKVLVIPDRKEAIRYCMKNHEPGDLITIIGLGHEHYQEANGIKTPYSDKDFVLETAKELFGNGEQ